MAIPSTKYSMKIQDMSEGMHADAQKVSHLDPPDNSKSLWGLQRRETDCQLYQRGVRQEIRGELERDCGQRLWSPCGARNFQLPVCEVWRTLRVALEGRIMLNDWFGLWEEIWIETIGDSLHSSKESKQFENFLFRLLFLSLLGLGAVGVSDFVIESLLEDHNLESIEVVQRGSLFLVGKLLSPFWGVELGEDSFFLESSSTSKRSNYLMVPVLAPLRTLILRSVTEILLIE